MGAKEPKHLSLANNIWEDNFKVTGEENEMLMRSFLPEELDQILRDTKTDTAPGPDGLPIAFFKNFWDLSRELVLSILNGFALGTVDVSRLNFGILSLIPKVPVAESIKQYRPIALINVLFKLVAKAYAARLSPVAHRVIAPNQTTFIKGRAIHEGALLLHEIVHELKSRNLPAVLLKLDFEKAYDRVSWAFLREVLLKKGFSGGYAHRIMQLVMGGQTAIAINGEIGPYFRNKRGV